MSDSLGRRAIPAMTAFFISTLLGFLTGLGIGGGSLLILWLTQVQGIDQSTARLINLIFFLPGALPFGCAGEKFPSGNCFRPL